LSLVATFSIYGIIKIYINIFERRPVTPGGGGRWFWSPLFGCGHHSRR
jgi:hypothetical protein